MELEHYTYADIMQQVAEPGDTFYKSGELCTVIRAGNDSLWFKWEDDPETDVLYYDTDLDNWEDVELTTETLNRFRA